MSLIVAIGECAAQSLKQLDACHDYFTYTKRIWRTAVELVTAGRQLDFRNPATKTRLLGPELNHRSQSYLENYLLADTFSRFISILEDYLFGIWRIWLKEYPASLSKKQIEVAVILETRKS